VRVFAGPEVLMTYAGHWCHSLSPFLSAEKAVDLDFEPSEAFGMGTVECPPGWRSSSMCELHDPGRERSKFCMPSGSPFDLLRHRWARGRPPFMFGGDKCPPHRPEITTFIMRREALSRHALSHLYCI